MAINVKHSVDRKSQKSTLERIRAVNQNPEQGRGIRGEEFVPLARYYSRLVAEKLIKRLEQSGIKTRCTKGRMITAVEVPFEDRKSAFFVLEEFREQQADIRPRGIRRDFDIFLLVGAITFVPTLVLWVMPKVPRLVPLAWLLTSLVLAMVLEYLQRHHRHYQRLQFSIWDLCVLILLASLLAMVWRYAL